VIFEVLQPLPESLGWVFFVQDHHFRMGERSEANPFLGDWQIVRNSILFMCVLD